jgi:hypothetical protein
MALGAAIALGLLGATSAIRKAMLLMTCKDFHEILPAVYNKKGLDAATATAAEAAAAAAAAATTAAATATGAAAEQQQQRPRNQPGPTQATARPRHQHGPDTNQTPHRRQHGPDTSTAQTPTKHDPSASMAQTPARPNYHIAITGNIAALLYGKCPRSSCTCARLVANLCRRILAIPLHKSIQNCYSFACCREVDLQ